MRVFDRAERATHWHLSAGGLVRGWNTPWVYARPFKRPFSHEVWPLPSDTCISPGGECQRMSAGLLHMWLAFLSCSPSLLLSHSSHHLPLSGSPCSRNQVWLQVLCRTRGPLRVFPGLPTDRLDNTCLSRQRHLEWRQCCLQRWASLRGLLICFIVRSHVGNAHSSHSELVFHVFTRYSSRLLGKEFPRGPWKATRQVFHSQWSPWATVHRLLLVGEERLDMFHCHLASTSVKLS